MPGDDDSRFPWPHELDLPGELEGWEELYPEYFLFDRSEDRTAYEHEHTWFLDLATTEPLLPWDLTVSAQAWQIGMAQNTSRVLPIPPAMSVDIRLVAGYAYIAGIPCEDPDLLAEREELFDERSEYWYEHFERLYREKWKPRVERIGNEIQALDVPDELPRYVSDHVVEESVGRTRVSDVLESYHRLVELALEGWQRHFEFLYLAYLAYMDFYEFCKDAFPQIPDNNVVKMVSAVDADLYRPDEELTRLAELAVELGDPVVDVLTSDRQPKTKMQALEGSDAGEKFLAEFDAIKDPWLYMSRGDGFHSYQGSWIDDLEVPFEYLDEKIRKVEGGEPVGRDFEALKEQREDLAEEYRSYLTTDEEKEEFDRLYRKCLNVYEYAEDHQFWIEHRLNTVVFRKMRAFGDLLVAHDLLEEPDDVFLFDRFEVAELLEELCFTWAVGPTAYVPGRWKERAERRTELLEAAREWSPPPALGEAPDEITDPLLIMLYGITTEKVESWLGEGVEADDDVIEGFAASTGRVEGPARVIESAEEIDAVQEGEVLVCPLTNPSWASIFPKISAAVTDKGGITSHAAVVCREYGLPAVTGTEIATATISTGDLIRVDGSTGSVEILRRS